MINFTVGPVQSNDVVKEIGKQDVPYFRTPEFSEVVFQCERYMGKFTNAGEGARTIFLTGSGTAAMEAVVMNAFSEKDKVLIINGGSFGARFVQLCLIHGIQYTEVKVEFGHNVTAQQLEKYSGQGYTGLLVNIHETSTGVLYDIDLLSKFCRKENLFFVVDAVSSFIADPLDMSKHGIDIMITGSQKALACPPGISIIELRKSAVSKIYNSTVKSMYFDLSNALKNGERGQTPFTPAVGIILQIHARLKQLDDIGFNKERNRISQLAQNFREGIKNLPLEITSTSMSNAVTPLHPLNVSATKVVTCLKDEYDIWVCPNGGELADTLFRVGHIGNLCLEDNTKLLNALFDMKSRGVL